MFQGVKLLCMGPKDKERPWIQCLNPVIVPSDKFLKIANRRFKCPICAHESDKLQPFFIALLNLKKAADSFDTSGFYIKNYFVGIEGCHEDGLEITPYVLENNDWTHWNMQVSAITCTNTEDQSLEFDLWEDHFYKARPFVFPPEWELTFGSVLRRRSLYIRENSVSIPALKSLIKGIRNYNEAWLKLLESYVTAAPVDLNHSLYTFISEVDSLIELFPETDTYK